MKNYIELSYKNKEEWHRIRDSGIGGSDAGAIMGKNKYKSIIDVWNDKTGRSKKKFKNSLAQRGHDLENVIRNAYKVDNPDKIIKEVNATYMHSKYKFILANLDGEIEYKGKRGVLEIKTTTVNRYDDYIENWKDNIPESYKYQILHYLLVTGYEYAVIVSYIKFKCFTNEYSTPFDLDTRIQTIIIDRKDFENEIEELLNKEIEFWECVKNDTVPHMIKTFGG